MATGDDDERGITRHELAHLLAKANDMAQIKTPGAADTVRVGTPPSGVGADVTTIAGTVPVKSENLSSADQISVTGDGSTYRPLEGSGGTGTIDVLQDGTPVVSGASELNFTGEVNVADAGGGRAVIDILGGAGVAVLKDGASVVDPASALNFTGMANVTDAGSGQANIQIGALDVTAVLDEGDSPIAATIGQLVRVDASAGAVVVGLPAIAAGNKGLAIAVKAAVFDSTGSDITVTPNGGNTIDGAATLVLYANEKLRCVYLVSDGTSNWEVIADYVEAPIVHTYQGDGTADIDLDIGDTSAFVAATGAVEGTQHFVLPDGKQDGQTMTINVLTSGFDLVVEVTNHGGGDGGTNTCTAGTPAALFLVWRFDDTPPAGNWYIVSTRGFVNS